MSENKLSERDEAVIMAKLAEEAQRYDDMVAQMKKIALMGVETTAEERNLLSVAYKNVIGTRRTAWRIVNAVSGKEENRAFSGQMKEYQDRVEKELQGISDEITDLLNKYLIPNSKTGASKLFYYKMKGDYHRYVAEFSQGDKKEKASQAALEAYTLGESVKDLPTTDPIRLGWALNFSVFYYEIMGAPDKAIALAKKAFDQAASDIEEIDDDSYKDCTFILQLIRDNLTLWDADKKDADGKHDE